MALGILDVLGKESKKGVTEEEKEEGEERKGTTREQL